ncbi:MAG: hypothetical protein IT368_07095 [Candidatus Hydrogenedentes bacterium]|nr:hypothetical protein [Candidatus Hydrogenedentota bacterium]
MSATPQPEPTNIVPIQDRALENLSFIREAMDRSLPVTTLSGKATMLMGIVAIAGGTFATRVQLLDTWIYVWLAVAAVGATIGFAGLALKTRRQGRPVLAGAARRFGLSLFPPIIAGLVLTNALYEFNRAELMPGTWLLLYGTGVMTGGAFSTRLVPFMGVCFMLLGSAGLLPGLPLTEPWFWHYSGYDLLLLTGFGGFHLLFGLWIALRYDG